MNSNNPLKCDVFLISLNFKGIGVSLGPTLENFDLIALQPNLLMMARKHHRVCLI